MFSNLYQLYLHIETCVALANLQWSINKNRNKNQISHGLDMINALWWFFTKYIDPPNCVRYWVLSGE